MRYNESNHTPVSLDRRNRSLATRRLNKEIKERENKEFQDSFNANNPEFKNAMIKERAIHDFFNNSTSEYLKARRAGLTARELMMEYKRLIEYVKTREDDHWESLVSEYAPKSGFDY